MGKSLLLLKRSPWKRKRKRQLNGDTVHTTLTSLSHGNRTSGAITLLLPSKKRKRNPWKRKRKRQLNGDMDHTTLSRLSTINLATALTTTDIIRPRPSPSAQASTNGCPSPSTCRNPATTNGSPSLSHRLSSTSSTSMLARTSTALDLTRAASTLAATAMATAIRPPAS